MACRPIVGYRSTAQRAPLRAIAGRLVPRAAERSAKDAPAVVLFPDCFTLYNEPRIGRAAVRVLEALGYRVILPRTGCCGRSMISCGDLEQAVGTARSTARQLFDVLDEHDPVAVVGCEPSCVSAITDDWLDLKLDLDPARLETLAARTAVIEQFLESGAEQHPRPITAPRGGASAGATVLLHGHCHQKALWGLDGVTALLRRFLGERLEVLDSGCCGMAGGFGYTADHYDLSMQIGELSLFPPIRAQPDAIVLAPGTSCRHQIHDGTARRALHPIELIAETLTAEGRGGRGEVIDTASDHRGMPSVILQVESDQHPRGAANRADSGPCSVRPGDPHQLSFRSLRSSAALRGSYRPPGTQDGQRSPRRS